MFAPVKPSVEQVCRSLVSISRRTGPHNEKRSNTATISHEPRLGDAANGELASHTHRARASVGELDDGPGTRNRRNGGVGRRAAETEHVPTQSAASSVAATPPPAFLRCRLSGTLDDGAPFGRDPAARLRRLSRPLSPATGHQTLAIAFVFRRRLRRRLLCDPGRVGRARVVCHGCRSRLDRVVAAAR